MEPNFVLVPDKVVEMAELISDSVRRIPYEIRLHRLRLDECMVMLKVYDANLHDKLLSLPYNDRSAAFYYAAGASQFLKLFNEAY